MRLTYPSIIAAASVLLPAVAVADKGERKLTWTDALRMNEIQVIGSHNSFHREISVRERPTQERMMGESVVNLAYSQPSIETQLDDLLVRSLEFDVYADPKGKNYAKPKLLKLAYIPWPREKAYKQKGTKVLNYPDFDWHTTCITFVSCLEEVKSWLDRHPESVPISIIVQPKAAPPIGDDVFGARRIPWDNAPLLEELDNEIRSVFKDSKQLIVPDDLTSKNGKKKNWNLEQNVRHNGWPDLDSARGRVYFLLDTDPEDNIRAVYKAGRPNLEERVMFTNAYTGDSDCAFQSISNPKRADDIREAISAGYMVLTRADQSLKSVMRCDKRRRGRALRSGAQIVSTDFEGPGMSARWNCDYVVKLPESKSATCNPVLKPVGCKPDELEPRRYWEPKHFDGADDE